MWSGGLAFRRRVQDSVTDSQNIKINCSNFLNTTASLGTTTTPSTPSNCTALKILVSVVPRSDQIPHFHGLCEPQRGMTTFRNFVTADCEKRREMRGCCP